MQAQTSSGQEGSKRQPILLEDQLADWESEKSIVCYSSLPLSSGSEIRAFTPPPRPQVVSSSQPYSLLDHGIADVGLEDAEPISINTPALSSSQGEECFSTVSHSPTPNDTTTSDNIFLLPAAETESTRAGVHPRHNYSDGSITFQVGSTLYRIHRHVVEISPILLGICDKGIHVSSISSKPTNAIIYLGEEIKPLEFEALVDLLYTPFYAANDLTSETHRLALPLCVKWGFQRLKDIILSRLDTFLEPVECYIMAHELALSDWEKRCLDRLVARRSGLTLEEGRRLGIEAVILISKLREEDHTSRCQHTAPISCEMSRRLKEGSPRSSDIQQRIHEWLGHTA